MVFFVIRVSCTHLNQINPSLQLNGAHRKAMETKCSMQVIFCSQDYSKNLCHIHTWLFHNFDISVMHLFLPVLMDIFISQFEKLLVTCTDCNFYLFYFIFFAIRDVVLFTVRWHDIRFHKYVQNPWRTCRK